MPTVPEKLWMRAQFRGIQKGIWLPPQYCQYFLVRKDSDVFLFPTDQNTGDTLRVHVFQFKVELPESGWVGMLLGSFISPSSIRCTQRAWECSPVSSPSLFFPCPVKGGGLGQTQWCRCEGGRGEMEKTMTALNPGCLLLSPEVLIGFHAWLKGARGQWTTECRSIDTYTCK